MEYFILYFLLFACAFAELNFQFRNKKFFGLLVIFLILFAGTRYRIGTDYMTYSNSFDMCKEGAFLMQLTNIEAMFVLLSQVSSSLVFVLIVYALIGVGGKGYIIQKASFPFTCLLLYYGFCFLFFDMGIMRQGAAFAISLFSIKYVLNKDLKRFLLILLLSTIFIHRTSIFFIFAYFIKPTRLRKRNVYLLIALSFAIGFIVNEDFLLRIVSFLPGYFSKFAGTVETYQQDTLSFGLTSLRKAVIVLFLVNFLYRKLSDKQIYYKYLINMYFWGTCASIAFVRFPTLSGRGTYYYCIAEMLLLPLCLKYIRGNILKNIYLVMLGLYSFLYMRNIIYGDNTYSWMNLLYLPYNSVLYL